MLHLDAWNGLRVAAIVGLLASGSARSAESSPIASTIDYGTTGKIDPAGVTGTPVVRFEGVDSGKLTTGGPSFDLGHLVVSPLAAGQSTTYDDTPFNVTFLARKVDGVATPDAGPGVLQGWLKGTVTGGDASKLRMFFVSAPGLPGDDGSPPTYPSNAPPFASGRLVNYLSLAPGGPGNPSPASSGGSLSLQGVIYSAQALPSPLPEPTTLALFGSVGVALAFGRIRNRRRVG